MAAFYRILLLLSVAVALGSARKVVRSKRSLLELAEIIKCSTGRNPLSYIMYGCYCGAGGQGKPLDKTDRCCHAHDCCYEAAEKDGCHTKTKRYPWKCDNGLAECDDLDDDCEKKLCKCDKEIARCLKKARYNIKNAIVNKLMCKGESPKCEKKEKSE